jgi:hypothetical protein
MKHYTAAACFTSFVLPYVLFVREFEERQKAVMTGCLAWNISLFPDPAQREQQIHRVWEMVEADNPAPPPGLEHGYKNDLRMLAEQKCDLFPWLMTNIPRAELSQNGTQEMLSIRTGKSDVEEVKLVIHPDPLGLPIIIEVLRGIQQDTAEQVALMERVRCNPGVLSDIDRTVATTAYCVQRADLIGYHRMLTVWRETQPAPRVKSVIGYWLEVFNEIEVNSKAVLNSLVSGD